MTNVTASQANRRPQLSVRLTEDVRVGLERFAERERRTLSSAVNHLLARELSLRGELDADRRQGAVS
jgi:hypothetical protein